MKKTGVRQMIFGILGSLACGVSVMGCYPLVPAYFTALYLEQVNGVVLLAFMYIGMTLFMPLTAAVKYGVTLIVMIGAVKLIEWANEGCPAFLAGVMAGLTTLILSFCGSLLEWKNQPDEMGRVFRRVVDVPDEDVFQRGHLVSSPAPFFKGRNELGERPFFVDRHDLVANSVRGSVQGNGQTDLPVIGRQFFQAGHESRRGDGDVARPYFQTAVGSDDFQGIHHVVKIGKGFPHAHEDDVVDPFSRDGFRGENLPDDFPRGERSEEHTSELSHNRESRMPSSA